VGYILLALGDQIIFHGLPFSGNIYNIPDVRDTLSGIAPGISA